MALSVSVFFGLFASVSVFAATDIDSSSSSYKAINTHFGSGGEDSCSTAYCSKQSVGSTAVGDANSANYGTTAGNTYSDDALLEVTVDGGVKDLGNLGISAVDATATASSEVSVRSYLSAGYVIQLIGTPPKINNHTINTLTTPTASQIGVEQFGVNMVANTSPSIGANPSQFPDSSFAYGVAANNYDTPNLFAYNEGDIIAGSSVSSGKTIYTLSFMMNIASSTPAGLYTTKLHALVVPTY